MTRIAHGEVEVSVNDRDAIARLEEIRAVWKSTMDSIDRDEAKAKIDADIKPLESAVAQARREVRRLEGEKAEIEMGVRDGDEEELAAALKEARAEVKRLDGEKAVVEIETHGAAKAIAELEAVSKAEEKRRRNDARRAKADRAEIALNDRVALSMASRRAEIAKLQQAYKKQSDDLERLNKKRPIGREERINVEINKTRALGEMERLKFMLNRLGKHPPIEIEPKVNRRGFQRVTGAFTDLIQGLGRKAAGLSDLTLRLGPFTTTVRQLGVALSFLGPILVDVAGAAGALVGVLGTATAGALSVTSGVVAGLGLNFAGMLYTMRPVAQDFKIAMTATNAYTRAVDKFGKNSTQAQKAHDQMVHAMKAIDPNARRAIVTLSNLRKSWEERVGPTAKRDLGSMIKDGALAIKAIMPAAAANTIRSFDLLKNSVASWSRGIRSAEGINIFKSLGESANQFLAPALDGLGHLAAALGRVAESGARLFAGKAGEAFRSWAEGFDNATKNGDRLDAAMTRLGQHAADVLHFFGALGRLLVTVFNGGADAGDNLVVTMTKAMNRWNDFLKTASGQQKLGDFFDRSIDGAKALWAAFAPLISAFVKWASFLAPMAAHFFRGAAAVAEMISKITSLIGLGGSVGAFAATLGALWAVGKIGAFVSMLARAVELVRELGALGTLKAIATGGFFGKLRVGSEMAQGGVAAGAEIRGAMAQGGAAAAAEIRGAMATGGAAAAAESRLGAASRGGVILPAGAAAQTERAAASASRGARAFGALKTGAVGALGALTGLTPVGAVVAGTLGVLTYAVIKLINHTSEMTAAGKRFGTSLKQLGASGNDYKNAVGGLQQSSIGYRQSLLSERDAHRQVIDLRKQGKKGTDEYKEALLNWRQAQLQTNQALNDYRIRVQHAQAGVDKQVTSSKQLLDQRTHERDMFKRGSQSWENYNQKVEAANKTYQATLNRQAALPVSFARVREGLSALTGAAEQAVGALARLKGGAPIAKKIALKFDDPGQVQRVATNARNTLKSGVPGRVVTKIVADSKNAEDAVRRLQRARITPKKLQIVESGGRQAIAMLERIIGRRLTRKEQEIAQRGGPRVIAMLEKILGQRLPAKTQLLAQRGGQAVLGLIHKIIGTRIPDKNFAIKANNLALGAINAVRSALGLLHDKTVNVTVNRQKAGQNAAAGRRAGMSELSFVGEGSNWRGAREYIANAKTGTVTRVDQPVLMPLSRDDAVIPTEPRYRDRGRDIFKEIARELNIPGFKRGKSASPRSIARAHGEARSRIKSRTQPNHYSSDNLRELSDVEAAKRAEDNFREVVQREAGQLEDKEPTTFLKVVSTDAETGDPVYAVDQGAIDSWSAQLESMAKRFDQLVAKIGETASAVARAIGKLGDPYNDSDDNPRTVIGRSRYNIKQLNKLISDENKIIKRKGTSKAAIQRAKERIGVYEAALSDERGNKSAAIADWKLMDQERNEIGDETRGRLAEALDSAAQYRTDEAALPGKAAAEAEAANPKKKAAEVADPFAAANNALAGLSAEEALAQIGQGMGGRGPRTAEAINKDIASYNQQIIDQANAMLRDSDTSNDQAAYSAIQSAAQAISGLSGGAGAPGFAAGQQMAYGNARADLYRNFGSNFALASSLGMTGGLFSGGGYSYGVNPSSGPGGVSVPINQTFYQMPDPHTWSQGVKFELQAAM